MVSSLQYSPRYPSFLVLKMHFQLQHLQRIDTDLNSPPDLKFLMTCHLLDHIVPQKSLSTSNMFPYTTNNIKESCLNNYVPLYYNQIQSYFSI